MRRLLALLALLLPQTALPAAATACRDEVFEATSFTLCEVTRADDLRLFLNGADGPYGSFAAVNDALAADGATLGFAMNAGMYHRDLSPVGLFVQAGRELAGLVTRDGPGNFGLLPNGVFCWGEGGFRVVESRTFKTRRPACTWATQSGPMLVIGGALHPKLLPDSDSLYIRNGVGVSPDGSRAVFAISNDAVNFHRFARLFRDHLGLPDALYFDGSISRLYAPNLGRSDLGFPMGPIVGAVVPKG
ncbi:phosphodiester glycosidase family protein [Rhodobacter sp. Har01]|uniref:phosphodiester glycosidase family protein n=1 Tax=Rhodobacter sp. Har01 TaxID=2883999 RepID=UPI001D08F758|nr:phosphodiester glycosidase family protein [Rhodobacter sp. Har01]MCB6179759.1 phosphodiester glycosidase family protein [Rhodobacter sp. Har01]